MRIGPPTAVGRYYQVEPAALELFRSFESNAWESNLKAYLKARDQIKSDLLRERKLARIPIKLSSGELITISPGGQNPLIKAVIEEFCPRFTPGGIVVYIGDAENKFLHLNEDYLKKLGVNIPAAAKMPDAVIHDTSRDWLILVEAVVSAGPVDGKRRQELKRLFSGCKIGLVFVSAFATREAMRGFLAQISWETEVWIEENPDHLIHFNGHRFLGPYPDTMPKP